MTDKVNVIIMAHEKIGAAFVHAITTALGELPLPTTVITVSYHVDPDEIIVKTKKMIHQMSQAPGFLILTDLFGATPSNIASSLQQSHDNIYVVTGLNLPMLIRVMNYAHLTLPELVEKALSGGKDGIISY